MLERPFLGALAAHLQWVESDRCASFATDAQRIYVNPIGVAAWGDEHIQFLLAHQTLHCALGHAYRRGGRERMRWHIACDYAVNQLLIDDGLQRPPAALWHARFRGLSAEEIYAVLDDVQCARLRCIDEHWFELTHTAAGEAQEKDSEAEESADGVAEDRDCAGDGHVVVERDAAALERLWRERIASSAAAVDRGRGLSRVWRDLAGTHARPCLPWRTLLARFMAGLAADDFTYGRRSRREGDAVLPGRSSPSVELFVAIDTSGSIGAPERDAFLSEVHVLKSQVPARLWVLPCDHRLAEGAPWRFEPWEPLCFPRALAGGGGTRFTPVFEWIDRHGRRPDALIYLTDGIGEFPPCAPPYPVLWVIKGGGAVPWGERVGLN